MADFQALVTAVLDSSKLTDQIKNACNQPVTISGIRVDPSALRSSIQSALSGQTFNINVGNVNMSNFNRQIQNLGTTAGRNFAQNFNSELSHITSGNNAHTLINLQRELAGFKFDRASINEITRGLDQMDLAVSRVRTSINNGNLRITVTGIDEIGNVVETIKEIDRDTGNITTLGKTITREFDNGEQAARQFQKTIQNVNQALSSGDINKQVSQISAQFDSIALLSTSGNEGTRTRVSEINAQIEGLRSLRNEIYSLAASGDQATLANTFELFNGLSDNVRNAIRSIKADTGSLSSDIQKALNGIGDGTKIDSNITNLESKFKGLQAVVENFKDGTIKAGFSGSLSSISDDLKELRDLQAALNNPSSMNGEELVSAWNEYCNVLARVKTQIGDLSGDAKKFQEVFSGGIDLDFKKLESDFNSLSETGHSKLSSIEEDIRTLRSLRDTMNQTTDKDEFTSAFNKYNEIFARVKNAIQEVKLESKDFTDTFNRGLEQFKSGKITKDLSSIEKQFRSLKKSGHGSLDTLKKDYENLIQLQKKMERQLNDGDNKGFAVTFKQFEDARTKLSNSLSTLQNQTAGVMNPLISGLQSYAAQFFSIYQIVAQFKKGFEFVKDLNDAVTNISYTMDVSEAQLDTYKSKVVSMANDFKTSAKTIVEASTLYANANESIDSILKKTETATMLSNVTGMSGTDTAKMLQAIMNQFDLGQNDLLMISDTIQSVSQSMAYDFSAGIQEIYDGIKASGSVANEAGLSLAQYSSMLGTVIEQTGNDGGQVGNAFKTIFTRITKASATAGTMEEDISKAEESLRAVGVEVRSSSGEFRNLDDILGDLAKRWDKLSDVEKSNISYNVAGTRQTNILKSLMKAWGDYQKRVEDATNLTESPTLANQEKYAESLSGKLNDLTASAQAFWATFINDGAAGDVISFFSDAIDLVARFNQIFGSVGTVASGVGIASLIKSFA